MIFQKIYNNVSDLKMFEYKFIQKPILFTHQENFQNYFHNRKVIDYLIFDYLFRGLRMNSEFLDELIL